MCVCVGVSRGGKNERELFGYNCGRRREMDMRKSYGNKVWESLLRKKHRDKVIRLSGGYVGN